MGALIETAPLPTSWIALQMIGKMHSTSH